MAPMAERSNLPGPAVPAGLQAHCQRVAAWSWELARALGLSESDQLLVEQAALTHHESPLLVDDEARRSLLNALHLKEGGENPPLVAVAPQLLKTLRRRKPSS